MKISGGWKPKARNTMLNATFTSRTCKFTIWRWRCPTCAANSSFPSWRRCTTSSWWEAKNKFETRFCCDFKTSLKPYIFNYKNLSAKNQNQLEKILLQNQTQRPCPWWIIEFCDQQQPKNGRKKKAAKNPPLLKFDFLKKQKH